MAFYKSFNDLPTWLKEKIRELIPVEARAQAWVHQSIPALENKTIIEVMNSADGERIMKIYLREFEARLH